MKTEHLSPISHIVICVLLVAFCLAMYLHFQDRSTLVLLIISLIVWASRSYQQASSLQKHLEA